MGLGRKFYHGKTIKQFHAIPSGKMKKLWMTWAEYSTTLVNIHESN